MNFSIEVTILGGMLFSYDLLCNSNIHWKFGIFLRPKIRLSIFEKSDILMLYQL